MRLQQSLLTLLGLITLLHALALPSALTSLTDSTRSLFKRKGGGRGGGGGGASRGSSSSGGSSRGSSGGRTANTITPTYGGGRFYGGGAPRPYQAGARSPGGYAPVLLGGAALGFFPGLWLYGAYAYGPYNQRYNYTDDDGNNESLPVQCFCAQYAECGCGENNDSDYINSIKDNETLAQVVEVNGTDTLVVNGTLPNGTIEQMQNAAGRMGRGLLEWAGFWPVLGVVGYLTFFI
ncbi:hypothetical protein MBLNU230_g8528t1 [Neophaeotheca triangularis]